MSDTVLTRTAAVSTAIPTPRSRWVGWLTVFAFGVVIVLATANLEHYPRTWFDEGIHLQAARNLAETGRYGLASADGFRPFDTAVAVGPTVIAPTALIFRALGIGVIQGRLVPVAYLIIASLGLYALARQLYGSAVAPLAVFAFASATEVGPFANGRDAVGEVAAVAFVAWGTVALARATAREGGWWRYPLIGSTFGLAVLTKNQFVLLVPTLVIVWLAGRGREDGLQASRLLLLLGGLAIPEVLWLVWQFAILGGEAVLAHLHQAIDQSGGGSFLAPLSWSLSALRVLLVAGAGGLGLIGVVYVWLTTLVSSKERRPERLVMPVFCLTWLTWYVGFSAGWARYAVPAIAISSIFVAKLLGDLIDRLVTSKRARVATPDPLYFVFAIAIGGALVTGIAQNGVAVLRARDTSPQDFAATIDRQVESGDAVESFEWEIDVLTRATYYHPPTQVMVDLIRQKSVGRATTTAADYSVPAGATYLVDGPFSKLTGVYRRELAQGGYERVASAGEYDLYRRVDNDAGAKGQLGLGTRAREGNR
jgi:4-amino-4-deoxy-L-arabinose transferase-like glycosyltransferase